MKEFLNKINLFNCKTLPRKIFTFYFVFLFLGTSLLLLPISQKNGVEQVSFIDALFTASSAFSDTGLTSVAIDQQFNVFGQIIIMLLIQIGGIGLMALKVMLFLFIGKKIGLKERMFASAERGTGKLGGTVDLFKSALIGIFATELIATIILSIKFYFSYYDTPSFNGNILTTIFQALFIAISSTNNAGFDILIGDDSMAIFANDYLVQTVIMICLIIGGLGFPFFYDIKNYITCKKQKTKFTMSFFTKFVLRIYFSISLISLLIVFIIELTSGTLLYNENISLTQRIFYVIFNTVATRSAGFCTIDLNSFTQGSQVIFALLMWIGAAPASTGGGIRITTFFICILALIAYGKNRKEAVFLGRKIPEETVTKSLLVTFISQILLFTVSIIVITSSTNITFLQAYFEAASAFGTTGLTLGITPHLNVLSKLSIILLMFIGQLGVSSTILMWTSKKNNEITTTYPEEDILIN